MTDDVVIRDVEAVERMLRDPRILECYEVPQCGLTPAQLRAAVQLAESSGRVAALVCEDCQPAEKYLVIRLVDLPLLLAIVYEVLTEPRGTGQGDGGRIR